MANSVTRARFSFSLKQAIHDFAQITRGRHPKLFQGQVFRVDVFAFEERVKFAAHGLTGNPGEFHHIVEKSAASVRGAL